MSMYNDDYTTPDDMFEVDEKYKELLPGQQYNQLKQQSLEQKAAYQGQAETFHRQKKANDEYNQVLDKVANRTDLSPDKQRFILAQHATSIGQKHNLPPQAVTQVPQPLPGMVEKPKKVTEEKKEQAQLQAPQMAPMGQTPPTLDSASSNVRMERRGPTMDPYPGLIRDIEGKKDRRLEGIGKMYGAGDTQIDGEPVADLTPAQATMRGMQSYEDIARKRQELIDERTIIQIDNQRYLEAALEEKNKAVEDAVSTHRQAVDDYKKTRPEDVPVWQGIGLAIAAGMMHFGAALSGGDQSSGMKMINSFLQRRSNMYQAELAKRKGLIGEAKDKIDKARQAVKDTRQAQSLLEAQDLVDVGAELEKLEVKAQSEEQKNQIRSALAEVNQQKLQKEAEVGQWADQEHTRLKENQARLNIEQKKLQIQEQAAKTRKGLGYDVRVPGMKMTGERMPTKQDVDKVNAGRAVMAKVTNLTDRLVAHVKEYGTEVPFTNARAAGEAIQGELLTQVKELYALGAITGPDMELLTNILGSDPHGIMTGQVLSRLQTFKDNTLQGWKSYGRQYGYEEDLSQPGTLGAIPQSDKSVPSFR